MSTEIHLIGGCGSSGTTLLAWLLDGLHDLRSGPETGLFHHRGLYTATALPEALETCLDGRAPTLSLAVNRLKIPLVPRVFFMDREFHGLAQPDSEARMTAAASNLDNLLNMVLSEMARTQGIPSRFAWIDQTPKNCIAAREFLEWRPEARFIHLLRDGRDVMLSLARRWASEAPGHDPATYLGAAAARWTYDVHQARRAAEHPGYLEISYEDLVQQPLDTLNQILQHLGRPPIDSTTLEQHQSPSAQAAGDRFHGGGKKTWHAQPSSAIQTHGVGRWRRQLKPQLVDKMKGFEFRVARDPYRYHFGRQLEACAYV